MDTIQQVTELIHSKFDIPLATLQPDLPMAEYGLDSLSLAELLFTLEDEFNIQFPDHPENIDTLAGLARLIDELKQSHPA